jgi:hypothetical protein
MKYNDNNLPKKRLGVIFESPPVAKKDPRC